ncbi:MAG: chemotaxis protein CheA [Pseudohongiellaceae bacterium]
MDEIRQIFEAECHDGLNVIESGLLALKAGDNNKETINDIFRGAHSIKGGAATFGYANIADFTHVMETLLDRVRSDELSVSPPLVKLFLESVDCLRDMVECMGGGDYDEQHAAEIKAELETWLGDEPPAAEQATGDVVAECDTLEKQSSATCWDIKFKPKKNYLQTGNQPQHIFRALAELGDLQLQPEYDYLPEFSTVNPTEMHLSWSIELKADVTKEEILAEFDWVENECDVEITAREDNKSEAPAKSSVSEAKPESPVVEASVESSAARTVKKDSGSIRVEIDKIDKLLNLVGEMVINQSMLNQFSSGNRKGETSEANSVELDQGLAILERTTRELQEAVMNIRMLPVSTTFNRFPRLVYDLSGKLAKEVELKISGETTELDKTVLEKIADPLSHLIRNSLDHGIEAPDVRLASGKNTTGVINLSASHEGGNVVIRVADDGGGLNSEKIYHKALERGLVKEGDTLNEQQINNLIFQAGFSTADEVTDVSGRGVGMDVVRSNIEDIGGRVEVSSTPGKGSTFQITLPLTLAVLDGQLVQVGEQVFVVPLLSIVETVQVDPEKINVVSGSNPLYRLRGEVIPIVDMRSLYRINGEEALTSYEGKELVIVDIDRNYVGLVVDALLDQHQVVIKSLETNYTKMPGILGATILGDGTVSLIVDVTTFAGPVLAGQENRTTH